MRGLLLVLVTSATLFSLSAGCHHRAPEGPMEKAGRSVDDAAKKTSNATKDAVHDTKKDLNGR